MKTEDLYIEYARVINMCKGTKVKPWKCIKGKGIFYSDFDTHPEFKSPPYAYDFAITILEDMPVFVGDTVYHKLTGIKRAIESKLLVDDFKEKFAWCPPKRTFIMTAQWVKYDGIDEQIAEMCKPGNTFVTRDTTGKQSESVMWIDTSQHPDYRLRQLNDLRQILNEEKATEYLICNPHHYADMICQWARTGQPVWVRPKKPYEFKISDYENHPTTKLMVDDKGVYLITTTPDWNIPGAEYSFTPFEEEV